MQHFPVISNVTGRFLGKVRSACGKLLQKNNQKGTGMSASL